MKICILSEEKSMFIKDWKKDVFTIPNILSFFRLILIPVYVTIYLNAREPKDYFISGTILAVSCLTDMIDGQIARRFNLISNLGKLLDPIADKTTQLALVICLSIRYRVLYLVLILFLIKEFTQLFLAYAKFRQGKALPGAILAGKICTFVLFTSLIILVLFPTLDLRVVSSLAVADSACLIFALISYFFAFCGKHAKVQDLEN